MNKKTKGIMASLLLGVTVITGASMNASASSISFNANLSGNIATSYCKNTSDGARYFSNAIYGVSTKSTTGGTCITCGSGTLGKNKTNSVSGSVKGYSHAYAKGYIYKSAVYQSGPDVTSAVILK